MGELVLKFFNLHLAKTFSVETLSFDFLSTSQVIEKHKDKE